MEIVLHSPFQFFVRLRHSRPSEHFQKCLLAISCICPLPDDRNQQLAAADSNLVITLCESIYRSNVGWRQRCIQSMLNTIEVDFDSINGETSCLQLDQPSACSSMLFERMSKAMIHAPRICSGSCQLSAPPLLRTAKLQRCLPSKLRIAWVYASLMTKCSESTKAKRVSRLCGTMICKGQSSHLASSLSREIRGRRAESRAARREFEPPARRYLVRCQHQNSTAFIFSLRAVLLFGSPCSAAASFSMQSF